MRAIVLAGGLGTRLKGYIEKIPKALVPINGKPLIEHVLGILKRNGVKDIMISVAYMKEKITEALGDGKRLGLNISYIEEPEPLGTAGPLIILAKEKKQINESFFVVNSDNLLEIDMKKMIHFHKSRKASCTIALVEVEKPESYGGAVLEGDKIIEFVEKPKEKVSNFINSGYYIMEPEVFGIVEGMEKAMIEKDVFPVLAKKGKLYGFMCHGKWFDVGTPERYAMAESEWR